MTKAGWLSRLHLPGASTRAAAQEDARYLDHRARGLTELGAGRIEEARQHFEAAARLRPELGEAYHNLGRALEMTPDIERARLAYQLAAQAPQPEPRAGGALAALPEPPPERRDLAVGEVVASSTTGNRFQVLDIKKGGFGIVYIVRTADDGRVLALKSFQARFQWSEADRQRFEREALTWVLLDQHPNVVTAYSIERIQGFPCIVLEYASGGDLAAALRTGPLMLEPALRYAIQCCDGMAYAHGKLGLVHRDIKPSNCLLA